MALVEKVVTSFSEPGASVVLLAWPTHNHHRPRLVSVESDRVPGSVIDGVIDHAPGTEPDPELADALHTVERLSRTTRVERVPVDPEASGPASRPFWADLIAGSGPAPATVPTALTVAHEAAVPHDSTGAFDGADLIIASLRPEHSGDRSEGNSADNTADLVALFAARLLGVGGILVVLTHCDWATGELTDPTGAVVAAGQNADLLYLQHIVALHAPIRDGQFVVADEHPDSDSDGYSDDGGAGDAQASARHRALVRGLPAPHRRIHSDVLVFAQPHDHQPPPPQSTDATAHDGDRR
jgi:hypothetical protein